jgi:hypothetical protein
MKKIINLLSIAAFVASPLALCVVYIQSSTQQAVAQSKEATTNKNFPVNQPQIIDFEPNEGFKKLTERQQSDQLRDWLLLTAISGKGLSSEEVSQATYDLPTVRYNFMSPVANFEYGETRSRYIGDGRIVALVQKASKLEQRKDDLAHIADKHRKDQGEKPKIIEVFEYEITPNKQSATITRREELDANKIFSSEYGYYETAINSQNDIRNFLSQADDITFAEVNGSSLTVGGRKIYSQKQPGISIENIAALWQSDSKNANGSGFSLDPSFDYPSLKKSLDKAKPFLQSFKIDGKSVVSEQDIQKAEKGLSGNDVVPYRQLIDKFKKFIDSKQGIQLLKEGKFGDEIKQEIKPFFAQQEQEIKAEIKRYEDQYRAEIQASIQSLEKAGYSSEQIKSQIDTEVQQKQQKLAEIRKNIIKQKNEELASKEKEVFKSKFAKIDNFIASPGTQGFQSARYDGDLQGTEVGMVLFYTDLIAKIWALNYLDSTPNQVIPDFNPLTKIKVSSIYKEELDKLSQTRLWFGPQDKGFQVANDGNNLLFARNAARIYAASSDPLNPGKETTASVDSDAFLGWWNDHYEEVARHEPQYERLNQIMKWSLVINWLNRSNQGNSLNFLQGVSVKRDNWFPNWVKAEGKNLRFQQWQTISFFGKGYKGTKTETMPILASTSFKLFGRETLIKGGVSLPDQNTFKTSLPINKSQDLSELGLRSNIDYPTVVVSKDGQVTFKTLDNITYKLENSNKNLSQVITQAGEASKLRSPDAELTNLPFTRQVAQVSDELQIKTIVGDTDFGNLNIKKTANGFDVGSASRDIDSGYSMISKLSKEKGDIPTVLAAMDNVESVRYSPSQLKDYKDYYVKLSESDKWLRISEQPLAGSGGDGAKPPSKRLMTVGEPEDGARNFNAEWLDKEQALQQTQGFQQSSGKGVNSQKQFPEQFNSRQEAQKLVQGPIQYIASKKLDLEMRIQKIDTYLKKGDYTKAAKSINQSIKLHGSQPQLILRKAAVEVHQGKLNIENITREGLQPVDLNFLDEISNRNFKAIETDKEFIYVQDSPKLNNLDFKQPIEQSVPSGSGARLYKLNPGKVGGVKNSQSGYGDVNASSNPSTEYKGSNPSNSLKNTFLNNPRGFVANDKCQEEEESKKNESKKNENKNCRQEKPVYIVVPSDPLTPNKK